MDDDLDLGMLRPAYQGYVEESGAPILSDPVDIPTVLKWITDLVEARTVA